jgi:hypothetical protein
MYQIALTKEQFDLLGGCVLATIRQLNKSWEEMPIEEGRIGIQEQIIRCNKILVELTKVRESMEEGEV